MTVRKRGNSNREHEDETGASTTAVELNTTGTDDLPEPSPSPDTGTPLPDDPNVLKQNVKGLKSQLRKQKRQVLLSSPSAVHDVYTAIVGRYACVRQEEVFIPIRNHQLCPLFHYHARLSLNKGLCGLSFVVGILSASWFIPRSTLPALPEHLQILLDDYEFVMPAMPAFDFSAEWERFKSNIPEPWKLANDGREFLVGEEMKSRGLEAKYPVVLIPGIISTVRFPYSCPYLKRSTVSLSRVWNLGRRLRSLRDSLGKKSGVGFLWFLWSRSTGNGGWRISCSTL